MCLFAWFLEIGPLPHRVQWYGFFSIILLLCSLNGSWILFPFHTVHNGFNFFWHDSSCGSWGWIFCHTENSDIDSDYYEYLCGALLFSHFVSVLETLTASHLASFSAINGYKSEEKSLQLPHNKSGNINLRNYDCIPQFLTISSVRSRFSFLYWLWSSFFDIHCFFSRVTNLHSCSSCNWPLLPPQSSSAGSPPGALLTPVNWFIGAVLRYWGCVTYIVLNCFSHMSHLK